jgi:hypothetical protein
MRRILYAAALSMLFYEAAFGLLLDRPLSVGFIAAQLEFKLARGASLGGPKLVILAGSNGPYSHRCEVIEPILEMPCVNAGVAVGVGLDYLFARWQPLLHAGDLVYLPMEEAQYVRPRAASLLGPEAIILLRHDRATLVGLPARRWVAALFAGDLRGAAMSLVEMTLVAGGFHDPRSEATGAMNAWGDHVGHDVQLAAANAGALATATPSHVDAQAIQGGDGSATIVEFVIWAIGHGVQVVGGLPTGFEDVPPPAATVAAIRALYEGAGARFLVLSNLSRYPRTAFFDTAEHLNEPAQIAHSRRVAEGLAGLRGARCSAR